MGLFSIAKNMTKAVVRTATLPVAIVADAVTAAPILDDDGGYTARTVKKAASDVRKASSGFDRW